MTEEQLLEYHRMFVAAWQVFRHYVQRDSSCYEKLLEDIAKKIKENNPEKHEMAQDLFLAVVNELNRVIG